MNLRFGPSSERVLRASGLHRGRPVSAAATETFTVLLTIKSALFADGVFSAAITQPVTFIPLPAY